MPDLIATGMYTKAQLGIALSAVSISYGLSKFIMGGISDRSNAKYFLPLGLVCSALVMITMAYFPWATSSVLIMFILMFVNGWFQGMGWPPCGRTMVHWFSSKERGTIVSTWNTAHNVGGALSANIAAWGVAMFSAWQANLYFPAFVALGISVITFFLMKDTPQSVGLPPVEEYKNDYPEDYQEKYEHEFSTKEIFIDYVLKNKFLWFIALANVFVYFIRYGLLDWAPTYLREEKALSVTESAWAYALYEYAAIPGTILCGWMSDKIFGGRRAPVGILFMVGVFIATLVYWFADSLLAINISLMVIGFLIYGPVMLIGLYALELAPKKAAGAAAGFTGLFGYLGGSVLASIAVGYIVHYISWNVYFMVVLASTIGSIVFLALTIKHKKAN